MKKVFAVTVALVAFSVSCAAAPVVLQGIPAYNWYHGCGPTAAASVLGYWDLHGYNNLFSASGSSLYLTSNVQDQISSPAHNAKYDPDPDNASLPVPPKTSIADWFETSVNQAYGWSYLSRSDDAFTGYAGYRGYQLASWYEGYGGAFTWQDLVGEINHARPLMLLVDTDGNGGTDHFVPTFGYDDRGAGGLWYGCYTTWSEAETVAWYQFRAMGNAWGVGFATFVVPLPVPEPSSMIALLGGLVGLLGIRRRRA